MLPLNNELVVVDIDQDTLKDMLTFSEGRCGSRLTLWFGGHSQEKCTRLLDEVRTRCGLTEETEQLITSAPAARTSRHVLKSDTVPVVRTRWLAEGGLRKSEMYCRQNQLLLGVRQAYFKHVQHIDRDC